MLIDKELKKEDIVSYYLHGDHWHVFTKDGKEHITYMNPEKASKNETLSVAKLVEADSLKKVEVISIKRHGDHWHVYTSNGEEYITYQDPSALYPNIPITNYVGSHGENKKEVLTLTKETTQAFSPEKTTAEVTTEATELPKLHIIRLLGKDEVNAKDIVRILKHEDHYHIYDSNGLEGLTYDDPRPYYPHASFGLYEGEHNKTNIEENAFEWPTGITKIIDHKDHWHLYAGDVEVAVVQKNPRDYYPHAEWIEEDGDVVVNIREDELFSYDEIEAKFNQDIIPYLSNNLKAMNSFGSLQTNIPVFGSNGELENIFYWLHGDHYHAISLKQLIQKAKDGSFGPFSAREVVAILKYKILHPETELEVQATVEFDEIKAFLLHYYQIDDKRDVMRLYSNVEVYKNGETLSLPLSHFEKVDGKVRYKGELPQWKQLTKEPFNDDVENSANDHNHPSSSKNVTDFTEQKLKEEENLRKIASYLNIDVEDAFDVVYDIINDVKAFSIADLEILEGIIRLNGKEYPMVLSEE